MEVQVTSVTVTSDGGAEGATRRQLMFTMQQYDEKFLTILHSHCSDGIY